MKKNPQHTAKDKLIKGVQKIVSENSPAVEKPKSPKIYSVYDYRKL